MLENARRRWPAVALRGARGRRAGPPAPSSRSSTALRRLDRRPEVDVIVIARGGGSVEDLLPFSDETLCRAVAACRTPVVSAIGHEPDSPLLDLVADVRCSTPTDAGKRVVPDVARGASAACASAARPRPPGGARHRRARARPARRRCAAARCSPTRTCSSTRRRRRGGRTCATGPAAAPAPRLERRAAPTSSTPAPAWSRSARRRRWSAATPWCSTPTAPSCATPATWRSPSRCASGVAHGELQARRA